MLIDMRLARMDLGPGWIDLGYGEPLIVQQKLRQFVPCSALPPAASFTDSCYQPAQGNKELVAFLEAKYGAKVVVTNGAKQGISAVMYALKKLGHTSCAIPIPYWVSVPTLIQDAGLTWCEVGAPAKGTKALMITSPNNPDGKELTKAQLEEVNADAKREGVTLIHDAVYYTPLYTSSEETTNIGDVQIYSFAKMWGLSGLRVGYVVVHNQTLLPLISEYVERTTSGVSTASQSIALAIETWFANNPSMREGFVSSCREAVAKSLAELSNLNSEVLIPEVSNPHSMFAWLKVGPKLDSLNARVNILPGDMFGKPGYMRMNIAVDSDLIKTAVDRLNRGAV